MPSLIIPERILNAMIAQAQSAAPNEACGLLSGRGRRVLEFHPMTNADNRPDHFTLVPAEQFAVAKQIRAAGNETLAVCHSHPATPARPSEEDIRLAFASDIVYVILSLARTNRPILRGFKIDEEHVSRVLVIVEGGEDAGNTTRGEP